MGKKSRLRLLEYGLTLWLVVTLNFYLPRAMPGDPFLVLSSDAPEEEEIVFTEEQRQFFFRHYGLDRPLGQQYLDYLAGLVRGDLGQSFYYKGEVSTIILSRLPWTVFLVLGAALGSTALGIALGSLAAWYRNRPVDRWLLIGLLGLGEVPSFLLGLVLLLLFAVGLGWFPLAGAMTPFAHYTTWGGMLADVLHHAFLPLLTLLLAQVTSVFLWTRNSLITVLTKEYILTARAKGLPETRVRRRHALRNALLPVVTRVTLQVGGLASGAVLVENIYAYPGLGSLMREAVSVHDYPVVQGTFLVLALSVVLANFLADLLYVWLDPRVYGD